MKVLIFNTSSTSWRFKEIGFKLNRLEDLATKIVWLKSRLSQKSTN